MTMPTSLSQSVPPPLVKLRDELRRMQRAVPDSQVGIAFESPVTPREWMTLCANRSSGRHGSASVEDCGDCANQKHQRLVSFEPAGIGRCQICLCSPDATSSPVLDCLAELVKAIVEIHELSGREEPLLQELATSLETIDTLYESSLDLQSRDSLQNVTDRLLDRSVAAAPDISAVLWIREKDEFRPVAQRRCEAPPARPQSQGLVGRARQSGVPIVADGGVSGLVDTDLDPELRGAGPVVAIPVHTRQGLEAVLEVWRNSDALPFETPAIRLLEAIAQQATSATENDRLYRAALDGERMRQEIEIGAVIQQHLLFGKPAERLVGGEIGHCMIPSLRVSGDFYAFVRHSDACVDVVIGDVMGKGIPAALMGAATKIALLRVIAESKDCRNADRLPEPAEIVTAANRHMSGQLEQLGSFVTLFYARFDFEKKKLTYVDAGHTQTVHYIRQTGLIDLLHGEGFPLGFSGGETYQQCEVSLGAGDIIFAYSDGISEATDPQGLPYETGRIVSYLERNVSLSATGIALGMADEVKAYRSVAEPDDDLTCLVIKIGDQIDGHAAHSTLRHVIGAHSDQLEELRNWLAETLRINAPVPVGDHTIFGVQLALQEAATNIMFHGLQPGFSQEISVVARFEGSQLQLELAYDGLTFSRKNVPAPSFDGSRDRGFGLFLIDQLMDEVSYGFTEGHNTIRLSKELNGLQEREQ